jgi:hypothetical protein
LIRIANFWIRVGPIMASVSNDWIQKRRAIHRTPRPTCTCDLVCLDGAPTTILRAPDTSRGYFRVEPVRQVAFPSPPVQFNPKSREREREVRGGLRLSADEIAFT